MRVASPVVLNIPHRKTLEQWAGPDLCQPDRSSAPMAWAKLIEVMAEHKELWRTEREKEVIHTPLVVETAKAGLAINECMHRNNQLLANITDRKTLSSVGEDADSMTIRGLELQQERCTQLHFEHVHLNCRSVVHQVTSLPPLLALRFGRQAQRRRPASRALMLTMGSFRYSACRSALDASLTSNLITT